ncbi:hypothetical protein H4CHR_02900 [Variovorax sp. PBS-H4]|uniref:hypothetical protein n=1 Tax=Variovorax sp. PBS-H4 TaxID=434008 RepID=UPI0013188473|nr:hypothetical protein [Variovorax sp. PBS-H4]VTU31893.1 hypothetical protein H4CHR_02900 [Variovorax sp. PBS-H4]
MKTPAAEATITVTKAAVAAYFHDWERAARAGECISREEAAALTTEDCAQRCADAFWSALSRLPQ